MDAIILCNQNSKGKKIIYIEWNYNLITTGVSYLVLHNEDKDKIPSPILINHTQKEFTNCLKWCFKVKLKPL